MCLRFAAGNRDDYKPVSVAAACELVSVREQNKNPSRSGTGGGG